MPGATTVVVVVEVLHAYSEENMVIYPFVDWANAMGTEDFTAGICHMAISSSHWSGSEG